ncbi:MAG: hypothetical protein IJX72_04750 [Clostridia bacterium]|nr:hypothetical protein [Clostridia bacterium]
MDTNDRYFSTKTTPIRRVTFACILMAVGLGPALIMSLVYIAKAPAAFLIMLAVTVAVYAFIINFAKKQGLYQISFRNSTITLRADSAMESMNYFHFDDLEIRDFTFSQSKSQIAKDRGDIKIRGLKFTLENVEKFAETKKYIEENF